MQDLIKQYRQSLRLLRMAKVVPMEYHSMVGDTEWAIEIMETGRVPRTKWSVARWPKMKREVPVDPQIIARSINAQVPPPSAPQEAIDLLEELLECLTKRERESYWLVRGQGYSFGQAAIILKCKKASVQSYIKRAEKKIQFAIRKQTYSEGVI